MNIELSSEDLRQMPPNLSASLVNWLQSERLKSNQSSSKLQSRSDAEQLTLALIASSKEKQSSHIPSSHTHVKLSQLFDTGFTKSGMAVRIRLKQELAKKRGYGYVTKGLSIFPKGTVFYKDEEFDKPSPFNTPDIFLNGSTRLSELVVQGSSYFFKVSSASDLEKKILSTAEQRFEP